MLTHAELLQLGYPGEPMRLLGTISNVELALDIDRVDFLHEIEIRGEVVFFHFDFQLEYEADNPRRFYVYNGMLTELKKPKKVITVPFYLRPRKKEILKEYEVKVGDIVFHRFTYEPIKLWDYVDRIRSGELYIFAPLLPLLVQPMDEALLVEERELILKHESDPKRQNTLLTTAILVAAQTELFTSDFLWSLFKEDKMNFDNPVIAKLFDKYYGEKLTAEVQKFAEEQQQKFALEQQKFALEQQKFFLEQQKLEQEADQRVAQVETQSTLQWQELMLKVLDHRFKPVPIAVILLLQRVTPAQRSQVSDIILDAPDVEQCLQTMQQFLAKKD